MTKKYGSHGRNTDLCDIMTNVHIHVNLTYLCKKHKFSGIYGIVTCYGHKYENIKAGRF